MGDEKRGFTSDDRIRVQMFVDEAMMRARQWPTCPDKYDYRAIDRGGRRGNR